MMSFSEKKTELSKVSDNTYLILFEQIQKTPFTGILTSFCPAFFQLKLKDTEL